MKFPRSLNENEEMFENFEVCCKIRDNYQRHLHLTLDNFLKQAPILETVVKISLKLKLNKKKANFACFAGLTLRQIRQTAQGQRGKMSLED
jgi:hypothetical protein